MSTDKFQSTDKFSTLCPSKNYYQFFYHLTITNHFPHFFFYKLIIFFTKLHNFGYKFYFIRDSSLPHLTKLNRRYNLDENIRMFLSGAYERHKNLSLLDTCTIEVEASVNVFDASVKYQIRHWFTSNHFAQQIFKS